MVFTRKISDQDLAYARYAIEDKNLSASYIISKLKISKSAYYRIRQELKEGKPRKRSENKGGRPRKIDQRTERALIRAVGKLRKAEGQFTSKRLMEVTNIDRKNISDRTVRRALNRNGYKFLQARKKGILTEKDLKLRHQFARTMQKTYPKELWTDQINFYLDGVSFYYKRNPADQAKAPRGRVWRKSSEGLELGCTAKGSKEGSGTTKVVKLIVAISYDKGVIDCEQYDTMNGAYFKSYVKRKFPELFDKAAKLGRLWIQDGDPNQNCAACRAEFQRLDAQLLPIPPRNPDLNPIENIFNSVRRKLSRQAIEKNITKESYEEFSQRVINAITTIEVTAINKIIDSMNRRITELIKNKGRRLKY